MLKVLLGADGSGYAQKAAEYLVRLFQGREDVEVTMLHVKDMSLFTMSFVGEPGVEALPNMETMQQQVEHLSQSSLASVKEALGPLAQRAVARAEWGKPVETICEVAKQGGHDLIVLGSSGMGQITGIFLGSVSDRVAHRATVPVLIVR